MTELLFFKTLFALACKIFPEVGIELAIEFPERPYQWLWTFNLIEDSENKV